MGFDISKVASIELNREKPFQHYIAFKDDTGYILERIPVNESAGWEKLQVITQAWMSHPDFNPPKKIKEQ